MLRSLMAAFPADEWPEVNQVELHPYLAQPELVEQVRRLGPWFHNIEVAPGIFTKEIAPAPGPQPLNHPEPRWEKVKSALPEDMTGMSVLDAGCSDGFFSIKMAGRGASRILAVDGAAEPIKRMNWVIDHFGLENLRDLPGIKELKAMGLLESGPALNVYRSHGELGEEGAADDEDESDEVTGDQAPPPGGADITEDDSEEALDPDDGLQSAG